MTVFTDAIASGLAELTRVVSTPEDPLAYGSDLSCVSDLTENLLELNPLSPIGIAESLIRRLTCARGALPDDKSYGWDLTAILNRGATEENLREYSSAMRGECRKDDRVEDALITLTMNLAARSLKVEIQVKPVDYQLRDFAFTFAVTSADVVLESIG